MLKKFLLLWEQRNKIDEILLQNQRLIEENGLLAGKAEAVAKAKSDFLASVSHEIRTPMNAVIGMSELILREELPRHVYDNVHLIQQAGSNLLILINDILDLSNIESGKHEVIPVEYRLDELFNSICALIEPKIKETLTFTATIDESLPVGLYGDEVRIRQILLNILSNAVKHTQEGHVHFIVRGEVTGSNLILTAAVSDSGTGIRQEDMAGLFEEFTQFGTKNNRNIQGAGLGLPIAKKLCEMMGGDITVESVHSKGSTFTVTLTQEIRDNTPISAALKQVEGRIDTSGYFAAPKAAVLVVDDVATNLAVMKGLLEPYKMKVDTCESGEEAVELTKTRDYDLIFMDHLMPGIDGIEAMEIIRGAGEYYKTAPIAALTANALTGMRETYLEKGFSDYLAKPVEMPKLNALLSRWIPHDKRDLAENSSARPQIDNRSAILEVFLNDSKVKAEQIPKCLENGDMKLFTIYVHALKSASANVGEAVLSGLAAKLEAAAKNGDSDYINRNINGLLSELKRVIEKIAEFVGSCAPDTPSAEIPEETLLKLKTALTDIDISAIDEIMAEYAGAGVVRSISQYTLISDYDGAAAVIDKHLEEK